MASQRFQSSPLPRAGEGQGVRARCLETRTQRLRAVLRTYLTRGEFWQIVLIWPLAIVLPAPLFNSGSKGFLIVVQMFLAANCFLGAMVGSQAKLQFANPRARLLPDFASPHLIVAGAMVASAGIFEAWWLAWAGGFSALRVFGLSLTLIAASAWLSYWMYPTWSRFQQLFAFLLFFAVLGWLAIGESTGAFLLDEDLLVSVGLSLFGIAALAVLGIRLSALCEEMPEYLEYVPTFEHDWDSTPHEARRSQRFWERQTIALSSIWAWWYDARFRFVLRWTPAWSPLRRLLLRQLAAGCVGLLWAPVAFGFALFYPWVRGGHFAFDSAHSGETLSSAFFLPIMFAICMVVGSWERRRPYLARELLHPLGRTDFVRDLLVRWTCDTAAAAASCCAVIVVGLVVFDPRWLQGAIAVPCLVAIVAQYALLSSLQFWMLSCRGNSASAFGVGIIMVAVFVIEMNIPDRWLQSTVPLATIVAVTAAAVAWVYRLAFARWCRVELD